MDQYEPPVDFRRDLLDNASGGERKVLLVDDQEFIPVILSQWLEQDGYICRVANNYDSAVAALEKEAFALVLSDINMPGKSGIELLVTIKSLYPDTAVLMVTALDDRETAISALRAGAFGYLVKPFDHNEVLINVANALQRRQLVLISKRYERHLETMVSARTAEIRQREEEIALRLVTASEFRDFETGAHIRRIGLYSAVLAKECGWSDRQIDDIRVAATMHDVGKIGVPDSILLKPGKLTPEEFEQMKLHTTIGDKMLGDSKIPLLEMAREIALGHHEKWNGTGYPHKVSGEHIPQSARIVAIADVYDALVNKRVYKEAMAEEEAVATMAKDRGTHFDPELFDKFLTIVDEFRKIREKFKN